MNPLACGLLLALEACSAGPSAQAPTEESPAGATRSADAVRPAPSEPVPSYPLLTGRCYRIDIEALHRNNPIPSKLPPENFDEILAGVGFHFGNDTLLFWVETSAIGMHFVNDYPAVIKAEGPKVFVAISEPPGFKRPAQPYSDRLAPMLVHRHTPKIWFRRDPDGALESKVNFFTVAWWGISEGPLRLVPAPCPRPLPASTHRPG